MKCPNCGKEIADDSKYYEFCGTNISLNIILDDTNKIWLGVCAGEGSYYARKWGGKPENWITLSRINYILLSLLFGMGLLVYIIAYFSYKKH